MIQYVFYLLLLEISLLILLLLNTPLRAPVVELIAKLKHGRYRLLMITAAMVACLAVGASSLCKLYKNGTLAFTLPSFFDFILSKTRLLIIGGFVLGTAVVVERVQEFMWEIRCLRISNNDRDGEIMILKTKIGKMEVIVSSKIADMKAAETYLYNTNYKITRPEDFLYKNTAYWSSHSDIY